MHNIDYGLREWFVICEKKYINTSENKEYSKRKFTRWIVNKTYEFDSILIYVNDNILEIIIFDCLQQWIICMISVENDHIFSRLFLKCYYFGYNITILILSLLIDSKNLITINIVVLITFRGK